MPLSLLNKLFREVISTTPEVVSDIDGFLFAQRCESRWASGGDPVGVLLVYRSPLCRDTKPAYRPVADILLGARRLDMLAQGIVEDVTMMYGKAEYLIVRYTHEEAFPEGPVALPELRATIQSAINSLLGAAIAS